MTTFPAPAPGAIYAADLHAWKEAALAVGFDPRIVDLTIRQTIEDARIERKPASNVIAFRRK